MSVYNVDQAIHDIENIYPPNETKEGDNLLLEVVAQLGIKRALTEEAIIKLGSMNKQTQM